MTPLRILFLLAMSITACAPAEVPCEGTRPMVCTCVTSCYATDEMVWVSSYGDPECLPLCLSPRDAQ